MILQRTTGLAFSAACLTAIATMPANAQTAGTYGTAPGMSAPQVQYQPNVPYQGNTSPQWSTSGYQGNATPSSAGMGGTEVVTNGPQASPGDNSGDWSARQNVVQSQRYDRLLETNRAFREARMRRECGPITDPELRQQCFSSFGQDEPFAGSSSSRRGYHSESGR